MVKKPSKIFSSGTGGLISTKLGCFSLVAGMAPAEQNDSNFIGYGTFVFIDNSENVMAIIFHFHCFTDTWN